MDDLRTARERIVREHMETENRREFEATVTTFSSPRYEVIPTGETYVGAARVLEFLSETGRAFPDMHFELHAMHHADSAVIVETTFHGTHRGTWRGLPPTLRVIAYRMCNVFVFEANQLVCERLYFDLNTILQQVGIARDPTSVAGQLEVFAMHPIVIARALWNLRTNRSRD